MNKFFKIKAPNKRPIVVITNNGWAGLIDIVDKISDQKDTYIAPISLWELIKYIVGREYSK